MLDILTPKQHKALEDGNSSKSLVWRALKNQDELSIADLMKITGLPYNNVKQAVNELSNQYYLIDRIPSKYTIKHENREHKNSE